MDSDDEMMVQQLMQEEVEVAAESRKCLLLLVSLSSPIGEGAVASH
jgi:hypothetical protein